MSGSVTHSLKLPVAVLNVQINSCLQEYENVSVFGHFGYFHNFKGLFKVKTWF